MRDEGTSAPVAGPPIGGSESGPPQGGAHAAVQRRCGPLIAIGVGCSFQGLLSFRGEGQVDGELIGEVVASGRLRLGPTARVRARIEVDELIVEGGLEGDVVARERIELSATARVAGSIEAPRISLAEGCVFQGRCRSTV